MKRKLSTALVMLLAFVLLLGTTAITASAETTYEPIGGSTTIVKNLVVEEGTNIPKITFNYTIRRGDPQVATATTIEILASPIAEQTIGTAEFSNADTANTINGLPSDADPSNPTAGKKYVQKYVSITFPRGTFTKPGVYRYVINETNNHLPGVGYDGNPTRYLDVFVVADSNNVLSVNSYVLRKAATNINLDGEYVSNPTEKNVGYTNTLTQHDFEFRKTIAGNQGDKNKRFNFTLNITGANPGTYPITATDDVTGNPTSITVGDNGTATGSYSLTNGSTVKVIGLNEGAVCTVTEDPGDYTPTHSLDSSNAVSGASSGEVTLNNDHSVAFTNTRNGIIPTGIIMTIAPFAIGICVFGAVFIFIICRKKRRSY